MVIDSNVPAEKNNHTSKAIIKDYILQEQLGGGEYCDTFKGVHQVSQDVVAVKVFPKSSTMAKSLYEAEIKAYKALRGLPGILQLKDDGITDDNYFIVTEYIQDGSLRNILNKYPKGMNVDELINLFTPIADAIDRMHRKNIIHRDLKPENILVRNIGYGHKIFIADFGVVKFTNTSQQFHTEHTAGTYWYIAPESWNANPNSPQTKAVDIYALGVILYEALEGRFPFDDISEVLNNQQPVHPTNTTQKAGKLVAEFLLKAIHNNPEQRPASAKDTINGIRYANNGNLNEKQIAEQRWIGRKVRNYKIEEVLGTGKMGITLRANDTQANKQVVLKAFTRSIERNDQAYEKEIKSLVKLESGYGVLTPEDMFEYDDISFIVTEYQSGGTLRDLLNRRPRLGTNEIIDIFTKIAKAIDYIHEKKIVHRDMKPENIVYSIHEGKTIPFITDFGVSAILVSTQSSFSTHNIGTPRYMAPELFGEKTRGTKAVDIYAFGIMLYEAIEGHAPFEGNTRRHRSSSLALLAEKTSKELGSHAKNILLQTLAKDAEERPKTATEIMQQIRGQHEMFLGKTYGKYTIENFVGRGTFGATYRAHDSNKKHRKRFAFKILSIPEPLMHEIESLKRIGHHEGILPILDGDSKDGIHYIVTDYLNGINLRDMLQSNHQVMSLDEALKIFKPIAKAIDYLHDIGMVHGDIKPENVILCKNKNDENSFDPFITGFGISKIAGKVQAFYLSSNINYIAPELWDAGNPLPASDIYAFGVMLYEALEGTTPFNAKSFADIIKQYPNKKPPVPKNLLQIRGKNASDALLQSIDKNPGRRQTYAQTLISQIGDKTQDNTSTKLGRITDPLLRSLRPIINAGNKKIELSLSGLIGLGIMAILLLSFVFSLFAQQPLSPTTTPSQSNATQPSLDAPAVTEEAETHLPSSTDVPITITPVPPLDCNDLQYPPIPVGWKKDYTASSFTLIKGLYPQYYGKIRDNLDLYAVAYYNNRKAFETGSYDIINPEKLGIDKGSRIFLPPPSWIDKYREFPIPVLETINQDDEYPPIKISGSSALYPLSQQIKGCLEKVELSYKVQIEPNNTKSGLIDFCQGRADMFGASEEVTPKMISDNGCLDVNFLKFEVARYATVIFMNNKNPYADELRETPLNGDELARLLFSAQLWSDVRSAWDSEPITRYYPPTEGGLFEIVKNNILPTLDNSLEIANLNIIKVVDMIPQEVADDRFSIGFSGYADYQSEIENLIPIGIDNVFPNSDTIKGDDPSYPLARSLYLYISKVRFNESPSLRFFINYYLTYELDFIDELGYFYPAKQGFLNDQYYPRVK